jgi:DNA protecting protein DprA
MLRVLMDPHSILSLMLSPGNGRAVIRKAVGAAKALGLEMPELLSLSWRELINKLPPGMESLADDLDRCSMESRDRARFLLNKTMEAGVQTVAMDQGDYPPALRNSLGDQAPPLLFALGDVGLLNEPSVAVVGARDPSKRGSSVAWAFAETFTRKGAVIVSGGAKGVDSIAHETALRSEGKTIVVLPLGILIYRVPEMIFKAAGAGEAVIVSEFAPDMDWATHAAVTRNAVISAFAGLVCVVEPKKTGGSVRTAKCALRQGKRVVAYPAKEFENVMSELADMGAKTLDRNAAREDIFACESLWNGGEPNITGQTMLGEASFP